MNQNIPWNDLLSLLRELQKKIRDGIISSRSKSIDFSGVSHETAADTIYQVDKISEDIILECFEKSWPSEFPVQLVMEGLEEKGDVVFPSNVTLQQTVLKCIMDPIDGTRNIMYDKRSAWILAGIALQKGEGTSLADIHAAVMTEIPTSKQWRSDIIRGTVGEGIVAEYDNVLTGETRPIQFKPSSANDFSHGFSSLAKFFPDAKTWIADIEEKLWSQIQPCQTASPLIFDDQYICSGGQLYEIIAGHDRMIGDLRPIAFAALGIDRSLVCHPYDVCTWILLREAGGSFHTLNSQLGQIPLDTTTAVAWVGFANPALEALALPVLANLISKK